MGELKPGIVICSRSNSRRVYRKPFRKIGGVSIINRLLHYLQETELPIFIAIPHADVSVYQKELSDTATFNAWSGSDSSPLERMSRLAYAYSIDPIIRVTHDKFVLSSRLILDALEAYKNSGVEYLYSSKAVAGVGFEIISAKLLEQANKKFAGRNIEHISYAVKHFSPKMLDFIPHCSFRGEMGLRFLVDYERDIDYARLLHQACQPHEYPSVEQYIKAALTSNTLMAINKLPKVSVYTCVYNGADFISDCISSVFHQSLKHDEMEYIVVDDASSDETAHSIAGHFLQHRIKYIRNDTNVGLASSSNCAIEEASGKYILRLDADHFFSFHFVLERMISFAESHGYEAVYPMYFDERAMCIKSGGDLHHPAGALFLTKAFRDFMFTDSLRGFDGKDLYLRIKDHLKIGYFQMPVFYYRNNPASLSNSKTKERETIFTALQDGLTGDELCKSMRSRF